MTAISDSGAGIGHGINGDAAHGTFSTGTDGTTGSAFIIASSIGNKTNQNNWSGIIFEGNSGKVYGDQTLSADLTIPNGNSLEIPQGSSLTIPEGVTLTNNGTLTGTGTISPDSYKLTAEITGLSDRTETYNGGPFTPRYTYTGNDNSKVSVKWYADNNGSKGAELNPAPADAGVYHVGVSAAASGIYKAVDEQTAKFTIIKAIQAAPTAAPKEDAIGTDRIKLQTVAASAASGAAAEYSKDGGATWQASPEFTGLSAGTSYTFTVRYAATGNYAASPAGPTATISTKPKQDGGSSPSSNSPSSSSTGGSSTGGSTSNTLNTPVLREILISDPGRGGSVTIPSQRVIHALNAAKKAAERSGSRISDIVLAAKLPGGTTKVTLEQSALRRLASSGIGSLKLDFGGAVTMTFDHSALEQIVRQTSGAVTFAADKAAVTGKALAAIGSRPAYDLTISYQRSGQTVKLPSVGGVAVALSYTPAPSERDGALYAVYADGGKAVWLDKSSYDEDAKAALFTAEHFSVYGVGYKAPPAFTDTVGHWARSDIDFVVSRGLLNGASATTFGPNTGVTRGMLVTALGRLAGIDPAQYRTGKFTDVKADADYAPYVNWAACKGVVSGTTATTFSPNKLVTRQQMAVIMANYARAMGYTLPKTREAARFSDNASIAGWAADAVKGMQMAGVLVGKDEKRFAPTATATRAEAAAALHRYVELVIDPQTAQGWDKNDSGARMYYVNGKPVTGDRTIDGTICHFNAKGLLTRIDAITPDTKKYITHVIVYGDTLWDLARLHHCTVAEIVALNGTLIKDPNSIPVGTEIKIPQE